MSLVVMKMTFPVDAAALRIRTQPVAQDVNSVVPAPVLKPTTADIWYFFDKESADNVFCKECKYVFC